MLCWGIYSKDAAGILFLPIETTMNGARYCKMLEDKVKTHMAIYESNMFVLNSAPYHCSMLVSDYFQKKNIKTLDWPGNIPYFNPIESLWAILKDQVADEHS